MPTVKMDTQHRSLLSAFVFQVLGSHLPGTQAQKDKIIIKKAQKPGQNLIIIRQFKNKNQREFRVFIIMGKSLIWLCHLGQEELPKNPHGTSFSKGPNHIMRTFKEKGPLQKYSTVSWGMALLVLDLFNVAQSLLHNFLNIFGRERDRSS